MAFDEQLHSIAAVRNVRALMALIERVRSRAYGLPGLGCFSGPAGYGKTYSATYSEINFTAVRVELKSSWTVSKLLRSILSEMGHQPARTVADMVDQITAELAMSDRPLILDEADHLVRRNAIEIVRDIADGSGAPLILIGEEGLPQKLGRWERVQSRVLDWVQAEPASRQDVAQLAMIYAPGIEVEQALREAILSATRGSFRRISVNLARAHEMAQLHGLDRIGMAEWGKTAFWTGTPPAVRKGLR